MLDRLPTRFRTALAAGLAALIALGAGAWWLRQELYDAQMAAARGKALVQARALARDNVQEQGGDTLDREAPSWPHVVLSPARNVIETSSPELSAIAEQLWSAPADAPPHWTTSRTVSLPPDRSSGAASLSATAVGAFSEVAPVAPGQPANRLGPTGCRYTVYVLATSQDAKSVVAAVDPALMAFVPTGALLVGVLVWATTRRALRPVEAICAELQEICESQLDRRVPIPRARDEIHRMAITANSALSRLERAAEQQRRFIADASHELRSPISALHTNLEVSLAHPDRTDWPETTAEALGAVQRLRHLTEDLLFLARPTKPATSAVDLVDLAQELVTDYRHTRPDGPTLTLRAPGLAFVPGNPLQLHRLLRNLLDNAVRHATSAVTITVTRQGPAAVLVEVHNDGSDIPSQDRERIFSRFTRLDEARSRDAGGSGLGLAIARDIALRHGGVLQVADRPPGSGTAFQAVLPVFGPYQSSTSR